MVFSVCLVHRDGARDFYELGRLSDEGAAMKRARDLMLVSQSAVRLEIFSDDGLVARLARNAGPNRAAA